MAVWLTPNSDNFLQNICILHDTLNGLYFVLECAPTLGGDRQFFCPTTNKYGESICVTLEELCNSRFECPNGEDEDETMCLFHRPVRCTLSINGFLNLLLWCEFLCSPQSGLHAIWDFGRSFFCLISLDMPAHGGPLFGIRPPF